MKASALGLEMSRHVFLWVIRSDAIRNMCAMDTEFKTMFSASKELQTRVSMPLVLLGVLVLMIQLCWCGLLTPI
jgi:hypothetical protein